MLFRSTVGRLVAEQLHCAFADIDAIIARKEGRPITMIFAEKGEATFRTLERAEMESALGNEPAVIAPGGGWAAQAQSERSDVTAVPALGVIAEAMVALVLAQAMVEKFGGDALSEMKRNVEGYLAQVRARLPRRGGAAS